MSVLTHRPTLHRPTLRWIVPLLVAVVLAVAGSAVGVIRAAARSGLPERSAAQLLVDISKARVDGLSGTLVQDADLGLPSIPGMNGGSGSSDMSSLVSGPHTLRLWYAGPNRVRLALLGSLGESDLVRNGRDLWSWSSSDKSATHRQVPLTTGAPHSLASMSPVTPQQAADAALEALSPSTKVSTDGTAFVAGRSAYELVLRPRAAGTLVGSVRIAVDGRTHIPTRVQVFAKGAGQPAFQVGFTSFDPTKPPASVFRFDPPPGTKVTESSGLRGLAAHRLRTHERGSLGRHLAPQPSAEAARPRLVGKGWASVLVAKVPAGMGSGEGGAGGGPGSMVQLLQVLPRVHGEWGSGHLLRGTLFSALLTDDGRLAVGPVPPRALFAALDTTS